MDVRVGLYEEVTFTLPKRKDRSGHGRVVGKGNTKCKGPEVGNSWDSQDSWR